MEQTGQQKKSQDGLGNGQLEFVRFTQPALFNTIPRELFRQVAEEDDTLILENVYRFGPAVLNNALSYFYAIIDKEIDSDKENPVVGFFWSGIDLFTNRLKVFFMSVDKRYQHQHIVDKFKELIKFICDYNNLSSIVELYTLSPEAAKRYGCEESKCRIMEFNIDKNEVK